MQQVEINVNVKKEKGAGGSEKNLQAALSAGKFLASKSMKETFSLDFEALFLDMFTEIEMPRQESRPAQAAEGANQRPQVAERIAEPKRVERMESAGEYRALHDTGSNADRPAADEARASDGEVRAESTAEAPRENAARAEQKGETKTAASSTEKSDAEKLNVKAVRLEISAALQKKLSAEDLTNLKKKIEDLIEDEDLPVGVLVSEVLKMVSNLIGNENIQEIAAEAPQTSGEDMKKFFKKFLKELGQAVSEALNQPAAERAEAPQPQIDAKVESALQKLVQKMAPKPVENVAENEVVDAKNIRTEENTDRREAVREVRTEAPKVVELKRAAVKQSAADEMTAVRNDQTERNQLAAEIAAQATLKAKVKPIAAGPATQAFSTEGISDISRSARSSEGTQNFWQNSYNQNSSQKGLENTARTQKQASTQRPQQNPVFEQIVQNMKIFVADGRSEATIRLKPEFLGKVEMKVVVEDGKVNVRFTAENSAVRAAITENVQELKKQLSELGLEVENVNIMLAGEFTDANTDNRDSNENQGRESRRVYSAGALDEEEEAEETAPAAVVDGSTVRYVA